jgi:DNA replication protein DnaC
MTPLSGGFTMRNEIIKLQKKLKINKAILDIYPTLTYENNEQFTCDLLEALNESRFALAQQKRLKAANFPILKTLENYSFKDIQIPESLTVDDLKAVRFIENKENLVFYGNVGTGKTHLAIALGVLAIQKGKKAQYFTLHELINKLVSAKEEDKYQTFFKKVMKNDLLILDEWGYLPLHHEGARLIYEVISQFYEQKSLILTTNLEFSHWKNFLFDEKLTIAILDRIIHHSHLLVFNGSSYRKEHSLMK